MTGDFQAGPTQGAWEFNGGTQWWVMWAPAGNMYGPGGPIMITHTPAGISKGDGVTVPYYITSNTHGERVIINTINGEMQIRKLPVKTYTLPGDSFVTDLNLLIWMDKFQVSGGTALLTAHTQTSYMTSGDQITIKVTSTQIILTGTHVHFHYDNFNKVIDWNNPIYGESYQNFNIVIDK
jgi:hypothetical protein